MSKRCNDKPTTELRDALDDLDFLNNELSDYELPTTPPPVKPKGKDDTFKDIANLCSQYRVPIKFMDELNHLLNGWELYMAGLFHRHSDQSCPVCGKVVGNPALVDVTYFHEKCDCSEVDYPHLGERLAHRDCLYQLNKNQLPEEYIEANLKHLPELMFIDTPVSRMSRQDLLAIIGWHRGELKNLRMGAKGEV